MGARTLRSYAHNTIATVVARECEAVRRRWPFAGRATLIVQNDFPIYPAVVAPVFDRLFFARDDQFTAKTRIFAVLAAGLLVQPPDGLMMMAWLATTMQYFGWRRRKKLAAFERLTETRSIQFASFDAAIENLLNRNSASAEALWRGRMDRSVNGSKPSSYRDNAISPIRPISLHMAGRLLGLRGGSQHRCC
jgi:hypothetical protein